MPTQRSAKATPPKQAPQARAAKPASQTKTTHTRHAPKTKASDSFLQRVVNQAKELPAQIGHVLETVGDVATTAAKQTTSIVSDIAGKAKTRRATTKKIASRNTRRRKRK